MPIVKANKIFFLIIIVLLSFASSEIVAQPLVITPKMNTALDRLKSEFKKTCLGLPYPSYSKLDSFYLSGNENNKTLNLVFNKRFGSVIFREGIVEQTYTKISNFLENDFAGFKIKIFSELFEIHAMIPNLYIKSNASKDQSKVLLSNVERPRKLITNINLKSSAPNGLDNRNIVIWPSHGWYYSHPDKRWVWQRSPLFLTVEDVIPASFVFPYIAPMLEKAGATVFIPRERDIQTNEVLVDNDGSSFASSININVEQQSLTKPDGFAIGNPPYSEAVNPFNLGTYNLIKTSKNEDNFVTYLPDIPETGEYAVYISWGSATPGVNIPDAHYTLTHLGGKTEFVVNQQYSGKTWHYLGTYKFSKGKNENLGSLKLSNKSDFNTEDSYVSFDAVRFGGGMSVISRDSTFSNKPKYIESARNYLQYAGIPDTVIYSKINNRDDYVDDYRGRAEYANYLNGAPAGPNKNKNLPGFGIPIDLTIAFHTDAGLTENDTAIGTLGIYSTTATDSNRYFPSGLPRIVNRDLTDIVMTEITSAIRGSFDKAWTRRDMRDERYAEAVRANHPSMLLELLSHQNFLEMKYALDPLFRFTVSRAIYKGIVKFIAELNNKKFVIQPLPVKEFATSFTANNKIMLSWKPVIDSTEITSSPDYYIVYQRIGDGGFDNGTKTLNPFLEIGDLSFGEIYSFKIAAANSGGESFASEILAVCIQRENIATALIVNGFTKIAPPIPIVTSNFAGFIDEIDAGVADKLDFMFIGKQYNFKPSSQFITNDDPGFGSCSNEYQGKVTAGNTFDFSYYHGKALASSGISFVSVSLEAAINFAGDWKKFDMVDLFLGKQKLTPRQKTFEDSLYGMRFETFPLKLRNSITDYCNSGGKLLVSGSYIGSDLSRQAPLDSSNIKWAISILKYKPASSHSSENGKVVPNRLNSFFTRNFNTTFATQRNSKIYFIEAPDGIDPVESASSILVYEENEKSAATAYKGKYSTVCVGFPLESIYNQQEFNSFINSVVGFFGFKNK